jgi:hypothetical protein
MHQEGLSQNQCDELTGKLTYKELADLRAHITIRMSEMRDTGITQLRATIAEQANILGVDLKDLVPKKKRKLRKRKDEDVADELA